MRERKKVINLNKQTIIIALSILIFIAAVVAVSFYLGSKNGQDNQQAEYSADHQGQSASEEKFNSFMGQGKKVVLFFTEGVMCYPSCWNQIAAFGKDEAFKKEDTVVFSIVVDTKNEWDTAIKKMPELGTSTVLFDSSKIISKEYGVLSLPSSMHKGQFPGHTYLILDKDGVIRFVKDDPQMAVRNDELRAELEKLN